MRYDFLQPATGEKEIGRFCRDNDPTPPAVDPPDGAAGAGAAEDLYGEEDKDDYVNPPDPPDCAN